MITLFTKNICPKCILIKGEMKRLGFEYEEKNMDKDEEAKQEIINQGISAAPVMYVDGEYIFDVTRMMYWMEQKEEEETKENVG